MDIKPTKYKKGDMVRYHIGPEEPALGIILEQDGGKAKVHWVKPPRRGYSKKSAFRLFTDDTEWLPIYKLKRVVPIEQRVSQD